MDSLLTTLTEARNKMGKQDKIHRMFRDQDSMLTRIQEYNMLIRSCNLRILNTKESDSIFMTSIERTQRIDRFNRIRLYIESKKQMLIEKLYFNQL